MENVVEQILAKATATHRPIYMQLATSANLHICGMDRLEGRRNTS